MDKQQPDLFGARHARAEALHRVTINSGPWFQRAMAAIAALPSDWTGTGEDLRLLLSRDLGEPHTPHVWGALTAQAIEKRYLHWTGKRVSMRTVRSHARKTDVYRRGL